MFSFANTMRYPMRRLCVCAFGNWMLRVLQVLKCGLALAQRVSFVTFCGSRHWHEYFKENGPSWLSGRRIMFRNAKLRHRHVAEWQAWSVRLALWHVQWVPDIIRLYLGYLDWRQSNRSGRWRGPWAPFQKVKILTVLFDALSGQFSYVFLAFF